MLTLSLCNELLADEGKSLDEQAAIAAALGYQGLELAPGTLGPAPHRLAATNIAEIRRTVEKHELEITGLHWLLAPYPELSITDPAVAEPTLDVLLGLIELCRALGGHVLVHGSPGQRRPLAGDGSDDLMARLANFFRELAPAIEAADLVYCIEPLSPAETPVINRVEEAVRLVEAVGSNAFRTMIDTSAAAQAEAMPVAELIRRWAPSGLIGHIQVNDSNRGAPGTGDDPFADIVRALRETGWRRPVAVEPFTTVIDATTTAAIGAATMRALWEKAA